ncbi:Csu type fimbrial protein [Sphingobium algorifonticola]|uniref:SCPU domain-containing protein n=1 Tax=Sphingobium algorifonticola TaxID=2008318 RepID=A0A437JD74_9SPHN|nr:spore coat U domain-containing protein [Sphingobium algorifonticola]RVT43824.1 SCPU domain-containing protein [Sphingobium algorifonticola]
MARYFVCIMLALCLLSTASSPACAELTRDVTVSADVVPGCRIATTSNGSLGNADFGSHSGTSTSTVNAAVVGATGAGLRIECTPGITLGIAADAGAHAVSGQRHLAGPASSTPIPYDLYANGGTTPWTSNTVSLGFTQGGTIQIFPITARVTLPGNARAGSYTDTVHVTLTW